MRLAKTGAGLYFVWGLVHIVAAYDEFALGAGLEPGIVLGKINQGAWNLLFFAIVSIVIAVKYNWKNDPLGYWINLIMISAADIGFIIFVLLPGYTTIFPSILGPVFWISGAIFTTLGLRARASQPG